jgi:rhodanese-related sulfurtransferase
VWHNRNEFGAPEPGEAATAMRDKLASIAIHRILSVDLKAGPAAIVIDARCRDPSIALHIPGAVSFPHREMNSETTPRLDRGKIYVVYCDGIGCNALTNGAYKLARLRFRTKELLGGLDWWRRDGHPVAAFDESGSSLQPPNSRQQTTVPGSRRAGRAPSRGR